MYIHSKIFTHKLKFVSQVAGKLKFPEFYKFVAIEYEESDNSLYLSAFNGEIHLRTRLGLVEDKSVKMPVKDSFLPIGCFDQHTTMKSWSGVDDQLWIDVDYADMKINIKSSRGKTQEKMMSANSFAEMPDYGKPKEVPAPLDFGACIETVLWAADEKNIDVRCQGVYLTNEAGFLEVVATDKNVMAMSVSDDNKGLIEVEGIITTQSAGIIMDMMKSKKDVELASDNDGMCVYCGDDEMATVFMDENMFKYSAIVQHAEETGDTKLRFSREHMVEACRFISPYCEMDKMKIQFGQDQAVIAGEITSKNKRGKQEIPYILDEGEADEVQLITTTTRMLSCIKSLDSTEITISFSSTDRKHIVIYPQGGEADIETTIFSVLLAPEASQQEVTVTKKRKGKRRTTHRDEN